MDISDTDWEDMYWKLNDKYTELQRNHKDLKVEVTELYRRVILE